MSKSYFILWNKRFKARYSIRIYMLKENVCFYSNKNNRFNNNSMRIKNNILNIWLFERWGYYYEDSYFIKGIYWII